MLVQGDCGTDQDEKTRYRDEKLGWMGFTEAVVVQTKLQCYVSLASTLFGSEIDGMNIRITPGAKEAFLNVSLSLANPHVELLIRILPKSILLLSSHNKSQVRIGHHPLQLQLQLQTQSRAEALLKPYLINSINPSHHPITLPQHSSTLKPSIAHS